MFIVIESIDGGGKGRQREELESYYKSKKVNVKTQEFPDHSTNIWEDYLHPALHDKIKLEPGGWFSAFAFEKFLWQDELKKYKSDENNLFIADGYYTTTLVYQSLVQQKPSLVFAINFADEFQLVKPDLAIYLDVNPKVALERKGKEEGKEEKDIFEGDISRQEEIRRGFKKMVEEQIWCKWVEVDGNGTIAEVRDQIITALTDQ